MSIWSEITIPPQLLSLELQYGALVLLLVAMIGFGWYVFASQKATHKQMDWLLALVKSESEGHSKDLKEQGKVMADNAVEITTTLTQTFKEENAAERAQCERHFEQMLQVADKNHDREMANLDDIKDGQRQLDQKLYEIDREVRSDPKGRK